MKKIVLSLFVILTAVVSVSAQENLTQFQGKKIDNIRFDEKIGFFEVLSGDEIFYISKDMKYVFVGAVIDVESKKNLTEERLLSISGEKVGKLINKVNLDDAVKIGSGQKVVIEFSDPDCPFCRKAHKFFEGRKDVTRYVFFFPLSKIHPDAEGKVVHILCSENKEQAYKDVYGGKYDKKNSGLRKCDSGFDILKKHKQIASEYGVAVTPFFIINQIPVTGANFTLINEMLKEEK